MENSLVCKFAMSVMTISSFGKLIKPLLSGKHCSLITRFVGVAFSEHIVHIYSYNATRELKELIEVHIQAQI